MNITAPVLIGIVSVGFFMLGASYRTSHSRKVVADPWKPIILWQEQAYQHNADILRVQVWDAFSDMFLDTTFSEAEQEWLAEIVAESPFSFEELCHILFFEVAPICSPNLLAWPGGEWGCFDPDWLIPKCVKQQQRHPFHSSGHSDSVPFYVHLLGIGPASDAYYLLFRVQRLRALMSRTL